MKVKKSDLKKIRGFANVGSLSEGYAKKIGFRITDWHVLHLPDGWLVVKIDWNASDPAHSYKVKYAYLDIIAIEEKKYASLAFKGTGHRYWFNGVRSSYQIDLSIEVGISGYVDDHDFSHFTNTKYGALVFFSPKSFFQKFKVLDTFRDEAYFAELEKSIEDAK